MSLCLLMSEWAGTGMTPNSKAIRVIGITGGIGSGKSAVLKIMSGLGARTIDADTVSKEITVRGSIILKELVDFFGARILDHEGGLDRAELARIVFKDKKMLEKLNSITHKYIFNEIRSRLRLYEEEIAAEGKDGAIVAVESSIPAKEGFIDIVDEIWAVVSDIPLRIARVARRSGLNPEHVLERIRSQMSDEEYVRIADKVIENNGDQKDLRQKVEGLYRQINI